VRTPGVPVVVADESRLLLCGGRWRATEFFFLVLHFGDAAFADQNATATSPRTAASSGVHAGGDFLGRCLNDSFPAIFVWLVWVGAGFSVNGLFSRQRRVDEGSHSGVKPCKCTPNPNATMALPHSSSADGVLCSSRRLGWAFCLLSSTHWTSSTSRLLLLRAGRTNSAVRRTI
jgi:hypothetical protein